MQKRRLRHPNQAPTTPQRNGSRLACERLEVRRLFAGDAFHFDVNLDGNVTPMDALQVVNFVGRNGSRPVFGEFAPALDVNQDQFVSAFDALVIMNQIERQSLVEDLGTEVLAVRYFGADIDEGARLINTQDALSDVLGNPPDIDFSEETVAVFYRGTFPTGGYSVDYVQTEGTSGSGNATVTLRLQSPSERDMVFQAFTNPHIVLKLDGVIEQITFVDTDGNELGTATI